MNGAAPAPRRRVLVVDDDRLMVRAIVRILERGPYEITTTSSPEEALTLVRENGFDVVVTDVIMPQMTGIDLLRSIRSYDLDVPVILATGRPSIETAVEAVSLGAFQYLMKPLDDGALLKAVDRASNLHLLAKLDRDALEAKGASSKHPSDRAGLAASFDRALESMWIAFQPIIDVRRRTVFAYEALMRSDDPALPNPGQLLDAAERLDRLSDLGRRVRDLAAKGFEAAPAGVHLFVNLHPRDLMDPSLLETAAPLSRIADRVVLEITERAPLDGIRDTRASIGALRGHGFRLAVDDLGAGYAGLSSFVALEPEFVKLDMSLVRDIHESPIRERLVTSMTTLCRDMGIEVIAEGVENAQESARILNAGCNLVQGFFFARPERELLPGKF
ncbi:MAG: EAL domain-containing protein [Polyangiaceae bacterium]